jgi:NAD(P)-dependent dehydrogenase (short-subunit alcohol dehydrogenase family)
MARSSETTGDELPYNMAPLSSRPFPSYCAGLWVYHLRRRTGDRETLRFMDEIQRSTLKLAGRNALVTGAGRGIGREVAIGLAREGANVALVARTEAELQVTASKLEATGRRALVLPGDLGSRDDVHDLIAEVEDVLGPVGVLVNNAAAPGPYGSLWDVDPVAWEHHLRLNLTMPYRLCAAVLPAMIKNGWGRIVNVSSGASLIPTEGLGAYSVAKAGLNMLTKQLAAELTDHPGVSVVAFNPGPVDTAIQVAMRSQPEAAVGPRSFRSFQWLLVTARLQAVQRPARVIVALASALTTELSGQYLDFRGEFAAAIHAADTHSRSL